MNITIGQLAKAAGVNVETIRYYERRGLISQPTKPVEGFRRYSDGHLKSIRFIKRAQELGFSLDEIAVLLEIDHRQCRDVQTLVADKLSNVEEKIDDLRRLAGALEDVIKCCESTSDDETCPLIDSLVDNNSST